MATPLKTRPAEVRPDTEMVTETGEPIVAHIVKTEPGEDAAAKVLEARINGTPLEALCGHVWVPREIRNKFRCVKSAKTSTRRIDCLTTV